MIAEKQATDHSRSYLPYKFPLEFAKLAKVKYIFVQQKVSRKRSCLAIDYRII